MKSASSELSQYESPVRPVKNGFPYSVKLKYAISNLYGLTIFESKDLLWPCNSVFNTQMEI